MHECMYEYNEYNDDTDDDDGDFVDDVKCLPTSCLISSALRSVIWKQICFLFGWDQV